ncbi:uncharacterized protein LOC142172166 [Nicotiana tabacum]|uniref:Uncharacterized protein LOC142172166 n=1 Tax=Nicotiana tabacum TaxID=4097 RepID=A0AC58T489_TOBAC
MVGNEVSSFDHNHPLFLPAGDTPGLVFIPIKLTGPENYAMWSRAMKLALREKSKLEFVDGSCTKSRYKGIVYASDAIKVWNNFQERFDRSNLTRIYHLWTEIETMRQGTDPESRPSVEHLKSQRVLQFLMGLNESYGNVRSNILARRPVVTINEAYAIATQEESQRTLGVVDTHTDSLTMLAGKTQGFKPKDTWLICEHCSYKGHLKENCYKIVGYPPDFKSKKKTR